MTGHPQQIAGQLLIAGFEGTQPSQEIRELIREHNLGGVILYAKNCADAWQVLQLTNSLQAEARSAGASDPLLIAIDQEQGRVVRLREGVTVFPPMGEVAGLKDTSLVSAISRIVSRELLAIGINWNLAPVADVLSSPTCPVGSRSFGSDPGAVAENVAAYVRAADAEGLISCAKHFPGHGGTDEDSHFTSPRIDKSRGELAKTDLPPFRAAIGAGLPAMMTTHITFPSLDADRPATFSAHVVEGLLRGQLAFGGVAVSDDLEMAGASQRFTLGEGAVAAIAAGVDMVLVSGMLLADRNLPSIPDEIGKAAADGRLEVERLHAAAERVRRLKARYLRGLWQRSHDEARSILRCPEHLALLETVKSRLGREGPHAGR